MGRAHVGMKISEYTPPIRVIVVVCRDPAYSGSTAYADLGNIYSLYYNTVKKVTTVHKNFQHFHIKSVFIKYSDE